MELLLKNEPDNADAKKELTRLKKSLIEAKKKEKQVFGKIFASKFYEDMQPEKKGEKKGDEEYKPIMSSSDEDEPKTKATPNTPKAEEVKKEETKVEVEPV